RGDGGRSVCSVYLDVSASRGLLRTDDLALNADLRAPCVEFQEGVGELRVEDVMRLLHRPVVRAQVGCSVRVTLLAAVVVQTRADELPVGGKILLRRVVVAARAAPRVDEGEILEAEAARDR